MENQAPSAPSKPAQEGHGAFVCNPDCCKQMGMDKPTVKIGKKWATALSGFIAGAAVAAIILVPWMLFEGKFCDAKKAQLINSEFKSPESGAPAEAPAPSGEVMAPAPTEMPAPAPAP